MKTLSLFALLLITLQSAAQTTIVLQPHFANGIEATPYGIDTTSADWPGNPHQYCSDSTYYAYPDFCLNAAYVYTDMTWVRHFIRFSQLSDTTVIPHGAVIDSAILHLYGVPSSDYGNFGNSYYSGSPYELDGLNSGWVYELEDTFDQYSVTWNTMPGFLHTDSVAIAPSTTRWGEDDSLNVTAMVADMVANSNTGFVAMLQDETYGNIERLFGSCFYHDSTKHPALAVTYHMPTVTPLGVKPLSNVNRSISLYPNPATTTLNVKLAGFNNEWVRVNIYNVIGEKIYSQDIDAGINKVSIPVGSFSPGMYMLEVANGSSVMKQKFMKQ